MKENKELIEIDIKRIFMALLRRWWIVAMAGILCAALLFGYAYFFVTPQYSASIKVYVNNTYGTSSPGFSSSQISAAQSLARTYMVILKSRPVMDEVAEITGLPYTYNQLVNMTMSGTISETEVFETRVTCTNYKHAAQIANAIAEVLPDRIKEVVEGSSVVVVERAMENPARVSPSYRTHALLGFVIGALLAAAAIVILDLMDNSIHSEEYLEETYQDMPLLAVIPDTENPKASGYYKGYYRGYYVSVDKNYGSKSAGGEK